MSKETDYRNLAKVVMENLEFNSVLDIGCGEGYLLDEFKKAGKKISGADIKQEEWSLLPQLKPFVKITNINIPFFISYNDLVICLEVAEHSDTPMRIINNVIRNAGKYVLFSAAQIRQPGINHINCNPYVIWLVNFLRRNFSFEIEKTLEIITTVRFDTCWWLLNNIMVLKTNKKGG
jgi:SAM-dependent methyltransferase